MKLATFSLLALCLAAVAPASPALAAEEAEALAAINAQRAKKGCDPLVVQPQLQAAAEGHAKAMAQQNFVSHSGADGSEFDMRIRDQGYGGNYIAENIAAGQATAREVVASWMSSAGHKRNMLNCRYSETGLAMVHQPGDQPIDGNNSAYKYYWVQTFGSP